MSYEPVTIREAAQLEVLLFVSLAFIGALLVLYWGFQTYQFGRTIRNTPPEPIRSVAMGRTEIVGQIVPRNRVYDQPFTDGQCVYAEFTVKEYKRYPHDDDKEDRWETVQSGSFSAPFFIDDGTGRMLVEPNEDTLYEISGEHRTRVSVDGNQRPPQPVQEFLVGGGTDDEVEIDSSVEHVRRHDIGSVSSTSRDRRYIQTVIPVGEEAYVFGGATRKDPEEVPETDQPIAIQTDLETGEFIISDKDEFELARSYTKRSLLYIGAGAVCSIILFALLAQILITGPVYGIDQAMP